MPADYPGDETARQAFDVMLRRGWGLVKDKSGYWHVPSAHCVSYCAAGEDPFEVLVNADRWYRENVEERKLLP